jgi:hypothetical protein
VPLVESSLTVGGVFLYRSHVVPAFLGGRVGQNASAPSRLVLAAAFAFQATFAASWRGGRLRSHASADSAGINVRLPHFTARRRPAATSR